MSVVRCFVDVAALFVAPLLIMAARWFSMAFWKAILSSSALSGHVYIQPLFWLLRIIRLLDEAFTW